METMHNFQIPDLLALYSRPYDDRMKAWRDIGARDKAADIVKLTTPFLSDIGRVLEVGCGTGAVLQKLAAQNWGSEFVGIEISDGRVSTAHEVSEDRTTILAYDGKRIPFDDASFDLVYATHVLEHVTDERGFLRELRRVARKFVYLEVPCELNLRTSYRNLQTTLDIGHINAYTPESFALTLETSGLKILDMEGFDLSYDVHAFHTSHWRAALKMIIRRLALSGNDKLASRVFTYHWGALCEPGPLLNIL